MKRVWTYTCFSNQQLNAPVDIKTDIIRPLCLPRGETIPEDLECIVTGWGASKNKSI